MTTFDSIAPLLAEQAIELPSWAFGNSGTRFKVFSHARHPRTPEEKIADAAQVQQGHRRSPRRSPCTSRGTRSTTTPPSASFAADLGVALGTINSNTFQDDDYKFGSAHPHRPAHPPEGDRPPLRVHRHHERDRVARPEDLARRRHELPGPGRHPRPPGPPRRLARRRSTRASATTSASCSSTSSSSRRSTTRMFPTGEPPTPRSPRSATRRWSASTPATTRRAPTSSSSSCSCCASASSAPSTSTRASTPTTTSSWARPTRSSCSASCTRSSAAAATAPTSDVAFMLDQCHNVEDKIPGQIRSVLNVQEMTARALLVDTRRPRRRPGRGRRARRQRHPDGRLLHRCAPDLADWRESRGLPRDPMAAYAASGYQAADRRGPRRRHSRPAGGHET